MNQPGFPPYSVLQVLDHSGGGRFSLEPLNCGGTLTLKESHDKAFFYTYEYDYGRNCYPGGTIKMQIRDEDNLDVTLFSPTGEPVSSGILHRIDK
jgi:hypothetical protein